MARRTTRTLTLALLAALVWVGMPSFSTAAFAARTTNFVSIGASPDWTAPTVTLRDPGSPVKGTVTLTADANDRETGVQSVIIEYLPPSGAWTRVCTTTVAPYTCGWSTGTLADGVYDLRARAVDNAGYVTTSESVRTTVANNLLVVLPSPGDVARGTTALSAALHNTGGVAYTVRVEYSLAGANSWRSVCTNLASPYSCSWVTTGFANDYYDLRAVAVSGGTSTYSAIVDDVLVDNLAPSVTMVDPGSPLSGTRTFEATATDAHSGVNQVVLQYAAGSSAWTTLCAVAAPPYSCRYDTTKLVDGTYSFRAVVSDVAGNTTTSTAVTNRAVDNTVSSVSVEDPGAYLSGAVTLTATASSTAAVGSVRIQRAAAGTATWADVCTDTTAPFTCVWDTTTVTDGLYDLRALLVDGTGRTTISAVVTGRRVDNSPLRGFDVQTANGGTSVGRLDAGDMVTLTFTEQVNLASVTAGWTGAALPVTLRVRDGNLVGLTNTGDTFDVLRSGTAVNLGSANLKENYVKGGKSASFGATMTASTTVVNGVTATRVTVTLGSMTAGGGLRTVSNPSTVVWSPSSAVTDLYSRPASTAPASELGTLDREF